MHCVACLAPPLYVFVMIKKQLSRRFETTADTLCGVPFFEPLIESRIPYATDKDGYIFIDRDGELFAIILQWLRSKQRPPQSILNLRSADLLEECSFYGLRHLADMIQGRTCDMDLRMGDRKIREAEASAKEDPKSYQHMLIDVHRANIETKLRESLELPLLFSDAPMTSVKGDFGDFYDRLNMCSGNLLEDLHDAKIHGLILAGGAVLAALTGGNFNDIDIFLNAQVEDGEKVLAQIYEAILKNQAKVSKKRILVTRSRNAVSFFRAGPNNSRRPPVQVITSVVTCPLSLLLDFDIDSCCFAYDVDAKKVYSTPRGMRSLEYGVNVVDSQFVSPSYWRRRGVKIIIRPVTSKNLAEPGG